MSIIIKVLAQDLASEKKWISELEPVIREIMGAKLEPASTPGEPGVLTFIDATTPEAMKSAESKMETTSSGARVLMVSGGSAFPELLATGKVQDILVHPLRRLEILSKVYLIQRLRDALEISRLSSAFTSLAEDLQSDLELASRLQKSRLPKRFPEIKGFRVASRYLAGVKSGGDYFDLAESQDQQQLSILLSDSSSHGLAGAVLTVLMRVASKLAAHESRSASEAFRKISQELVLFMNERDQLSLFYATLSRKDYRLRYFNLGGSRAFLAKESKEFVELPPQGSALSRKSPQVIGEEAVIDLEPTDRLVVLSDGFIEAAGGPYKAKELLDSLRNREALDTLNEFTFRVKSEFQGPDDLPEQDCTGMVFDVDPKLLRLAR